MEFETMWSEIAPSLMRLGTSREELERLKTTDLDPDKTRICAYEVQQQALRDQCIKLEGDASKKHCLLCGFIGVVILLAMAFVTIIVVLILYNRSNLCSQNLINRHTSMCTTGQF